jgi:hypothetical protein
VFGEKRTQKLSPGLIKDQQSLFYFFSRSKIEKLNNFKVLEAIKPMSLNRIVKLAKITYARKEEDIRFTYGKIKPILLICIWPPY